MPKKEIFHKLNSAVKENLYSCFIQKLTARCTNSLPQETFLADFASDWNKVENWRAYRFLNIGDAVYVIKNLKGGSFILVKARELN